MNSDTPNAGDAAGFASTTSVEDLIADYFDDSISAEDFARLQSELTNDPSARDLYMDYAQLHHNLMDIYGFHYLSIAESRAHPKANSSALKYSFLAAVACLILILAGMWVFKTGPAENNATLEFQKQSVWFYEGDESSHKSSKNGRLRLATGKRLHLREGALRATLPNQVEMLIEAPAVIRLENDLTLRMDNGRGWFRVPREASGFAVLTNRYQVVDRGTEFGIFENRIKNHTEVHVFEGEVAMNDLRGTLLHELRGGDALSFDESGTPHKIDVAPDEFLTSIPSQVKVVFAEDFEYFNLLDNSAEPRLPPLKWSRVGTQNGVVGIFNPGSTQWYSSPDFIDEETTSGIVGYMNGPSMAYIYRTDAGTGMEQRAGTIEANSSYFLNFSIGHRPPPHPGRMLIPFGGYTVSLMSGNTVLKSISSDTPPGGPNSVSYANLIWKSRNLPSHIKPGAPLSIRITTNQANSYLDVDNIRLVQVRKE